ncbi:MAG: HD domain-containing protein [SAR324 cluster bacterium]|nr:HD domain-containing protein [SAR324 cluster bacterium]
MIESASMSYDVRCPMHGSIPLNERERKIIDNPYYQRLRFISQLGFSALVYPGATHSRFSHGLGVMHLAGKIFDHIISSAPDLRRHLSGAGQLDYWRQIVRFAGLLHDSGHLPFSHAYEPLLPKREGLSLPLQWYRQPSPQEQASHEDFSVAVVHALAQESPPLLSMEEARDVSALINGNITPHSFAGGRGDGDEFNILPLLKQIISGEIDADRMDYLRRDAYFAGVSYGYFDLDRLVQALGYVPSPSGLLMTLDENALYTYENFLMTRFHMTMQVYLHKTVLLFNHYLHRAVQEGEIECNLESNMDSFLQTREDSIMARLYEARDRRWASRIVHRNPFSRLAQFKGGAEQEDRERILAALREADIETIHIREERTLSNLGEGEEGQVPAIQVREERLGRTSWGPLHEKSVLLDRYNQIFVIENIYCPPEDYQRGMDILRSLPPRV